MMIFILILPIIFFFAAFIVNASMFRPEKRPEANIDGRRVTFPSGRNHLAGYLWNEAGTHTPFVRCVNAQISKWTES